MIKCVGNILLQNIKNVLVSFLTVGIGSFVLTLYNGKLREK